MQMTRTILSSLAVVALLSGAATPAVSQAKKHKPKYYKMELEDAVIVPVSPQASKHKGEIEIQSFSPGASRSARPSKGRRLQAR
jgi:hypothetical protein